jgi:hypothetical protein
LSQLIDSTSQRVALEATKFSLGVAGIKPAADASVNVNIELKAGYVIDLSEPDAPAAKIVGGIAEVIEQEADASPNVRLRYRIVARHYRELEEREEQADKARFAERMERARLQRQQAAAKGTLPATSDTQFFLIAAE